MEGTPNTEPEKKPEEGFDSTEKMLNSEEWARIENAHIKHIKKEGEGRRAAYEYFERRKGEVFEMVKSNPSFEDAGRRFDILHAVDYMLAKAVAERDIAQSMFNESAKQGGTNEGAYYYEKALDQLIDGLEVKVEYLREYARSVKGNSELAKLYEELDPNLLALRISSERELEQIGVTGLRKAA